MRDDLVSRVQAEIDRLRSRLEPEMLRHNVKLQRPGDIPTLSEMDEQKDDFNSRISRSVTKIAGSIWFAYSVLFFAGSWISFNVYVDLHGGTPLDDPWAFPTLLLCSNFIQLMMPIFILVAQGRAEKRDRVREDRDHILTLIGRRDVLLLFTYLSEFAEQQRSMSIQQRGAQEKLIALEHEQNHLSGELVPSLIGLIAGLSSTLRDRPCVLDRADPEVVDYVLSNIKEQEDGSGKNDSGEG